ncbi:MAG: hypothetical protein OER90_01320 [Gemmatimonadota bacterium]|nr:hypothetical protein [Gemmatimonadota bacterium]
MVANSRTPVRVDRLRALNTPRPVRVEIDAHDKPTTVTDAGEHTEQLGKRPTEKDEPSSPQRTCSVNDVLEIWRIDDEWWRIPICRRYVEVILEGGKHVVLFEDLNTGEWFEQKP